MTPTATPTAIPIADTILSLLIVVLHGMGGILY
jgi:hypothetical protein